MWRRGRTCPHSGSEERVARINPHARRCSSGRPKDHRLLPAVSSEHPPERHRFALLRWISDEDKHRLHPARARSPRASSLTFDPPAMGVGGMTAILMGRGQPGAGSVMQTGRRSYGPGGPQERTPRSRWSPARRSRSWFGERFVTVGDLERMLAMAGEIVGRFSPAPDAVIARGLTARAPGGSGRQLPGRQVRRGRCRCEAHCTP